MGAPVGNQNAAKAKVWQAAIMRALDRRGSDRAQVLADLADKLLDKVAEGDMTALRELGDRLDGRAHQSIEADVRGSLTGAIEQLPTVAVPVLSLVK